MKKSLAMFLMLLITVGCDDSAEIAKLREQVETLQKQTAEPTAKQPTEPTADPSPEPSFESIINTIGMSLELIPAGTFMMGSPVTEHHRGDDAYQHKVTISKAFYMQTTEVTQGQWKAVMGNEPWKGKKYVKEGTHYAATYVTWEDAVAFSKYLSSKEGKTYRLPSEAEWEYACRAGTKTTWSFGNDEKEFGDYAWYVDIANNYAHQVGLKKPNAFGLYDMHGNVGEWCHDYYERDYYKSSPEKDPTGPASGSSRVLRSGGQFHSAYRGGRFDADFRFNLSGFRLVRELD